jgi:hypothetical protein
MSRRLSRDPGQLQLVPTRPLPIINGRRMTERDVRRLYSRIGPQDGERCRANTWPKHRGGHAEFWINGKHVQVHRLIYLLEVGEIPEGYDVHHRCHKPGCCNAAHLELLTRSEHRRLHAMESDGNHPAAMLRARTHCQRCGHDLITRIDRTRKTGHKRECPICSAQGSIARSRRRRQQLLLTTTAP